MDQQVSSDGTVSSFFHPKNIRHGEGRILWVPGPDGGWVLPGGERTQDRERAERVARNIDAAIREHQLALQQRMTVGGNVLLEPGL